MGQVIYIVLTETGSILSRAIQLYTQENFNHVSIAFDRNLTEMYSFGRKFENNPFIGGFVQENIHSKLLRSANCAIYECNVTDEQYELLQQKIQFFKQHMDKFRYNFIGLIGVACRIKLEREWAFFCSQFIATLLKDAGFNLDGLCPYFMKPTDLGKLPYMHLCYKGELSRYVFIPRSKPMHNIPIASISKVI